VEYCFLQDRRVYVLLVKHYNSGRPASEEWGSTPIGVFSVHYIETLDVIGHRNEVVPSNFFRQEPETNHVGVIFPGFGYTVQMPLMYYTGRLLSESGADVFLVG
jgi:hypothetical protein